jgi:hypothetical protein
MFKGNILTIWKTTVFGLVIFAFCLVGCTAEKETTLPTETEVEAPTQVEEEVSPTEVSPTQIPPTATQSPTETQAPEESVDQPTPTEVSLVESFPPDAQTVEFQSLDGQPLIGTYYPSAENPAPLVVLMHWAPGDQNDWIEIAYWLQNRGLGGDTSNPGNVPWLDPTWFPPMFDDESYAVFTFTFRGCEGGCGSFDRDAWLMDAQAAMEAARELEGVDSERIIAIGASIGADGAPDGCSWLNVEAGGNCLGSFSLSPGDYLTVPYAEVVNTLGAEEPPKPAWCLYSEADGPSAGSCQAASGDHYRTFSYPGNLHGMRLIDPDVEPGAMGLMLEFLQLTFGE